MNEKGKEKKIQKIVESWKEMKFQRRNWNNQQKEYADVLNEFLSLCLISFLTLMFIIQEYCSWFGFNRWQEI